MIFSRSTWAAFTAAATSPGMAATVEVGTARKPVTRKCGDVTHDRDASPKAGIKQTCDSRERPAPFYSANASHQPPDEGGLAE